MSDHGLPTHHGTAEVQNASLTWLGRFAIAGFVAVAIAVVWVSNLLLTERYTILTRNRAEVRQALYAGNLMSELQRNSIVPLLLSRDPVLASALSTDDYVTTSQHLITYVDEIGAAALLLLDESGRVVAATDRAELGRNGRLSPYFVDALRSNDTTFKASKLESGAYEFTYARRIEVGGVLAGVIVVEVDLAKFETQWASISDAVLVVNSEGDIILSTEPKWRARKEADALEVRDAPTAIERGVAGHVRLDLPHARGLFGRRGRDAVGKPDPVSRVAHGLVHHLHLGARAGERVPRVGDHGLCHSVVARLLPDIAARCVACGPVPTRKCRVASAQHAAATRDRRTRAGGKEP